MPQTKIAYAVLCFTMLALAACSSSVGTGSPAPRDTTVVVPPNSSVTSE